MNPDVIQDLETKQSDYNTAVAGFQVSSYTKAPLRMAGTFRFNATANTVFERMTDPQLIAGWFGMVKGGRVDHSLSCNPNQWGEGSKRYCYTPMGTLDETMYYWQAPYICAYNAKALSMPVKDHCAVLLVRPSGNNSCEVTWQQYFNYKGLVMRNFFAAMMLKMVNTGIGSLQKEFGGRGGTMITV